MEVRCAQGLHARPVAQLVAVASQSNSRVTLRKGERQADGRSIMGVLSLGVSAHDRIHVEVDGADAAAVMAKLLRILSAESL